VTRAHFYNYENEESQAICRQIRAFLLGRPLHGATPQEISDMLGTKLNTTRRYLQYLLDSHLIHVARQPRIGFATIYKHGPVVVPRIKPGLVYVDLPLAFFKGSNHE